MPSLLLPALPHSLLQPILLLQDLGQLKQRLVNWLLFWRSANWRKNQKPFLLLASAQTTLGVRTILDMVKNRIWRWQSIASAQLQQQTAAAVAGPQQDSLQKALAQWQQLQHQQPHSQQQPPHQLLAGRAVDSRQRKEQQPQRQRQLQPPSQQGVSAGRLGSGLTTLYQLGVETNQQLMQEVLTNDEVCICRLACGCCQSTLQHSRCSPRAS
jgi:hypothetical protein